MPKRYAFGEALREIPGIISNLCSEQRRVCVAIDGLSGLGKSTFAAQLAERLGAVVIHMDDFYLPLSERRGERISQPGWNVDYERFSREVAVPFLEGRLPRYGLFDCRTQSIREFVSVPDVGCYVMEGCYSMHPMIPPFYDLRIVLSGERSTCRSRILARDGAEVLRRFDEEWIPLEMAYLAAYSIRELSDIIVECDD